MVWVLTGQTVCKAAAYRDWGDGIMVDKCGQPGSGSDLYP